MDTEKQFRVLIVEDGKLNQKVLCETLEHLYSVMIVETGEMALKMATDFRPHLILLDIILPDTNGFTVLKTLKETESTRSIPIIIITGLDNDEDEERGLHLGAVDYIRKPFNSTIVQARVRTHIQIIQQIQTIERLSFIDALTELPNRRKFDYQIEYEWHRAIRKQSRIGLLMMDLDCFKAYNDTYGHTQGDVLLQAVAKVLKSTLKRTTDVPCRWGGEEFAVLIPETSLEDVLNVAEMLRKKIEKMEVPYIGTGSVTTITVSIGAVSASPKSGEPLSSFIEKADSLLYRAKKNGRNQVQY